MISATTANMTEAIATEMTGEIEDIETEIEKEIGIGTETEIETEKDIVMEDTTMITGAEIERMMENRIIRDAGIIITMDFL